ncbi:hypothetical protein QR98_0044930 [Sarcoptes scabiei]|uniref:Uncharacterized protein n=1 Tax=Sarcoptes scabiei TaxID=52283 RepID=A0A132A6I6_SARSC|nr:hypothetical protein QR98_0044930 [Sarcoptes scabiei]
MEKERKKESKNLVDGLVSNKDKGKPERIFYVSFVPAKAKFTHSNETFEFPNCNAIQCINFRPKYMTIRI